MSRKRRIDNIADVDGENDSEYRSFNGPISCINTYTEAATNNCVDDANGNGENYTEGKKRTDNIKSEGILEDPLNLKKMSLNCDNIYFPMV